MTSYIHVTDSTHIAYTRLKFSRNRPRINGTLHEDQTTFSFESRLLLQGFSLTFAFVILSRLRMHFPKLFKIGTLLKDEATSLLVSRLSAEIDIHPFTSVIPRTLRMHFTHLFAIGQELMTLYLKTKPLIRPYRSC